MILSVMQPYLFPYLGYYQMVGNSDLFISYDNVDYIQRGWINRNKIYHPEEPIYFTVPVSKKPLGTPISDITIKDYNTWKVKFINQLNFAYKKAPFYIQTMNLIEEILNEKEFSLIADLSLTSIKSILDYFDFQLDYVRASSIKLDEDYKREKKLDLFISIFKATKIILPPGSVHLYENWIPNNCIKSTMQVPEFTYKQFHSSNKNNLSIIDVLMFNEKEKVRKMIAQIKFI